MAHICNKGSCKGCQFYGYDQDYEGYVCLESTERTYENIVPGMDAVFASGKVYGAKDRVYIIYANECANNGNGSFEIEILDAERILKLYEEVDGDTMKFFEYMPDEFQGEWGYVDNIPETKGEFDWWVNEYFNADFIVGRDGGFDEEMNFLVRWAKEAIKNGH